MEEGFISIIKKDGTFEDYNEDKIIKAVSKSASRVMIDLTNDDYAKICNEVLDYILENDYEGNVEVDEMHNIIETVLDEFNPTIAKAYKDYRNYKKDFVHLMDEVYQQSQAIRYLGDKENSNTDSSLVSTKRSLIFNELNKRLYRRFFLTKAELQACKEGYIYVHDQNARLDSLNCCLFDVENVMKNGFEMGNVWYNEPKTLDVAFDVIGDIVLSASAQIYGGFSISEIDKILLPYAEKSYKKYLEDIMDIKGEVEPSEDTIRRSKIKLKKEFEQGFQGLEMKFNTVGSSRGDYPFVSISFGLGTSEFEKMASITFLEVHKEGQGKKGFKKNLTFPKLIFLYDENIHCVGGINEDVFEAGIQCSSKTMYPDWLSLTGEGYVPSMYKKYGKAITPMGKIKNTIAHVKPREPRNLGCIIYG